MRRALAFLPCLVLTGAAAYAQQAPRLEPLPAPPPPPPGAADSADERPIRITPGRNEQIEETVIDGKRVVRITTPGGSVYYLDDTPNDRSDSQTGPRLRVPLWVIHSF